MRGATWLIVVLCMAGCAVSDPQRAPESPPATPSEPAATDSLPAAAAAYVRAWGANDVATMVRNSVPDSPARGFAEYWGDVYEAGRLDSGQADVDLGPNSATLTYGDGTTYSIAKVRVSEDGLVTWTARPGGPLAHRVVVGPVVSDQAGGVTTAAMRQYVNSDGDLRVSVRVRNAGDERRDLFALAYRGARGPSTATIGSGARTGVVQVPAGSTITALVSVEHAAPGGRLTLTVVDRTGRERGRVDLLLPG